MHNFLDLMAPRIRHMKMKIRASTGGPHKGVKNRKTEKKVSCETMLFQIENEYFITYYASN